MDILEGFGKRVREQRVKMGVSQEKFAAICKLDRTYISGIERGTRNPTLTVICRLAQGFGITPSELLERVAAK